MRGSNESGCATATDEDGFTYTIDCGYDSLFSFQEMGEIDLPAFVDDVLARTGELSLKVVGFSRGTS